MWSPTFSRYNKLAAKNLLADATVERAFHSPTHSNVTYRKPDGSLWHEQESHLEYPEDDYQLREVPANIGG